MAFRSLLHIGTRDKEHGIQDTVIFFGKEEEKDIIETIPQDKAIQFDYNVPMKGRHLCP